MVYLIIAIVFYTAAILLGATASRNVNSNLSAGIMNVLSAIIPITIAIPYLTKKTLGNHKFGIIMAVLAGIAIAIFSLAINKSYTLNKVGVVAPVIFGGAILFSSLLSTVFLKEKLTIVEGVGLGILMIGFVTIIYARAIAK